MAKAATAVERPSGRSISTKAGILAYNGVPCPGNKLDVIVVASVWSNTLYLDKFDPNNLSSPVCFAYSPDGENMKPHPASSQPQHDDCDTCPMNKWGSDPNGGRGKACKNGRSLALIPADSQDPATAEIAILKPPVTSVNNWQMFVQKCAAVYNRPPLAVICQVGTVPDAKSQYKVTFTDVGAVDNSLIKGLIDRQESAMDACMKIYEASEPTAPETAGKKAKH